MQELYGGIIIPEAVKLELTGVDIPVAGATEVQTQNWIQTRSVVNQELVTTLRLEIDEGEAEAIALAIELNAQLLLIDEHLGRTVASRLGLKFTGVLGVLLEAKSNGLITAVKPLLDNLIVQAGFWVTEALYNRVLQMADEASSELRPFPLPTLAPPAELLASQLHDFSQSISAVAELLN